MKKFFQGHLTKILKLEAIEFDDESVKLISKSAKGSVRDALTSGPINCLWQWLV